MGELTVDGPGEVLPEVRDMEPEQLPALAHALRRQISTTVERCGGHYASPLAVVELAIALHYVFDSPKDRVIWDTGHQSYAHKLLTGRSLAFSTLRCRGGAAGFPRMEESAHDPFGTGHTSTAIAAALGFSESSAVRASGYWSVAVVGDGALAGGPALEALTLVAEKRSKVCVVLNDNGYAISPSVGALARRWESSYRHLASAMDIPYIGPLDGHDLPELITSLCHVRRSPGPAFVHIRTSKGRGDLRAEQDPVKYYSCVPRSTAASLADAGGYNSSMQEAFASEVDQLARTLPALRVITPAMRVGAGLDSFGCRFPDNFTDVGIAEATSVTMGAALVAAGDRAIVHLYSTFLQRASDQIIHDVGLQSLPLVLAVDRVGLSGEDGPTHHGVYDLAILTAVPNMIVFSVSTAELLRTAMRWAVESASGPVAVRFSKGPEVSWRDGDRAEDAVPGCLLREDGAHATVLTHGRIGSVVQEAVAQTRRDGFACRLVEVTRLCPINAELLKQLVLPSHPIFVIEECIAVGSLGAAIKALAHDVPRWNHVRHLCIDEPTASHGSLALQLAENGLEEQHVARLLKDGIREAPESDGAECRVYRE